MKTLCIDAGNTLTKIAFAEDSAIRQVTSFVRTDTGGLLDYVKSLPPVDASILSSVSTVDGRVIDAVRQKSSYFTELTAETPVPIRNLYKTPETLGKDRLAAIAGAHSLFSGRDILVFDAGTALTVDFIDREGNYHGGNISPGLNMRFHSLHDYTQRLSLQTPTGNFQLLGDTTASAIVSGVQNGIIFEINCYMDHFIRKFPDLVTVLTGGDINFFVNKLEKFIFAEPNLVLIGLENIINLNFRIEKSGRFG